MDIATIKQHVDAHIANNMYPSITAATNALAVESMIEHVKGATFANITQATRVKTAATHKDMTIIKVTVANVMLANNLKTFTSIYKNRVEKEIGEDFVVSDTWFHHTHCYSIVKHNTKETLYLYAMYNNTVSTAYYNADTDTVMSKSDVAAYMTPSAAKKLLEPAGPTHNVTNDVDHNVTIRTIGLANVVAMTVNKQSF